MGPEYETAGVGTRFLADMADFLVLSIPIAIILSLITGHLSVEFTQSIWWSIFYPVYLTILPVFWNGYNIGKRIFGIRVEKLDGEKLTFKDMFMRECVGKVGLSYLTFGISPLASVFMILFRKDRRAVHDLIAKTYVSR